MSKFKSGDICKVLYGQNLWMNTGGEIKVMDLHPEYIGEQVVINYTYVDVYGGERDRDTYSVTFLTGPIKGNTLAWFNNNQLELIESSTKI